MMAYHAETFKIFSFWSCVLVLKILAMAGLTARYRFQKQVIIGFHFLVVILSEILKNKNPNYYIFESVEL